MICAVDQWFPEVEQCFFQEAWMREGGIKRSILVPTMNFRYWTLWKPVRIRQKKNTAGINSRHPFGYAMCTYVEVGDGRQAGSRGAPGGRPVQSWAAYFLSRAVRRSFISIRARGLSVITDRWHCPPPP